ncbi:MAG: hypothetical protein JEZ12_01980 [Desulfobacterium sp.]|nr:hypothetical protein [Desulfobacterium sp.]
MKTIEITDKQYERLVSHVNDHELPDSVTIERILNSYEEHKGGNGPSVVLKTEDPQVVIPSACKQNERFQPTMRRIMQPVKFVFFPDNEETFKQSLLKKRKAYIRIYKADGSVVDEMWNALRITKASKIKSCLRTKFGKWGITGIVKVVASTNPDDLS